jgi:DNA-binding NarL/FixJ family response regulator
MRPTVLIVDDHAGFRASARSMLELEGFDVVGEAEDGSSGIGLTQELRPDVVLLDIALPDASGFEVAERIASLPSEVVLTSSREQDDLGRRLGSSSVLGFIPKDQLSGAELSRLLRRR